MSEVATPYEAIRGFRNLAQTAGKILTLSEILYTERLGIDGDSILAGACFRKKEAVLIPSGFETHPDHTFDGYFSLLALEIQPAATQHFIKEPLHDPLLIHCNLAYTVPATAENAPVKIHRQVQYYINQEDERPLAAYLERKQDLTPFDPPPEASPTILTRAWQVVPPIASYQTGEAASLFAATERYPFMEILIAEAGIEADHLTNLAAWARE